MLVSKYPRTWTCKSRSTYFLALRYIAMYESIFSYGLSRPYPFRWFTPSVFIGGIIATAVLSFLNVAATGYEMNTVESSNPNATVASKTFFANWPSFMTGNTRPSCDAKILSVSNAYYTSNTAFSYKLESIWQNSSDGVLQYFGDVPYYNNPLRDCTIPKMEIFFQGLDRSALQISRQQWGAELKANIRCFVDIPEGSRVIELSTTYDFNSDATRFPGRNETTKPSLWWGESLLAWYYLKLTRDVYAATQAKELETSIYKGYIEYKTPQVPIARAEDYTSPSFFRGEPPGCFFVAFSDDGIERNILFCLREGDVRPFANATLWPTSATIVKAFHSTVLVDLGQRQPNIFVDQGLLQHFTNNISAIAAQQAGGVKTWGWGNNIEIRWQGGLALAPYTSNNASKWKLAADPSFMAVTYLCQVPRIKGTSSLIFSVLVADFVFLQVLWKIFILIVDFFMYREYANMGSCQGCDGAQAVGDDGFEMLRPKSLAVDEASIDERRSAYSPIGAP